jgi:hypothetical protein
MITDDDLLLYYYRELDAAERARIGAALSAQPELAQRLHRLVARLDAVAAQPEVPVPPQFQQRWQAALDVAATRTRAAPERRRSFNYTGWLAIAATLVIALVVSFQVIRPGPNLQAEAPVPAPTGEPGPAEPSAYEHGLKFHLASTERRLANLEAATPEERAKLIETIIGQNRIYALAAERAGEPQLARVLRAFTPVLEDVASGRAQSTEGSLAQLGFELRVMQARLGAEAQAQTTL